MNVFEVLQGDSPLVLAQPHGGLFVPDAIKTRLNGRGRELADTDWHIHRLYDGVMEGVTVVRSTVHRYVIDANRDPSGTSLYPGKNTTGLCPLTDFDGRDIWCEGQAPSEDEIEARRLSFHAPYHAALAEELARVQARHGVAILYDCHSIRSDIPFLFEGRLPIFNVGTNLGATCAQAISEAVLAPCLQHDQVQTVENGRFKGGWTTRHYGRPETGQHAIQMELAQRSYMAETAPWTYLPEKADRLRVVLRKVLLSLNKIAQSGRLHHQGVTDA